MQPTRLSNPTLLNYRIYKARPTLLLNEQFKRHIEQTASPETFPGIHPGPIDKKTKFDKLLEFEIVGQKRSETDRASCPMCQPNKYLKGFLVWLPELQAIAAIGHCCADKENLAIANKKFLEEQKQRFDEDFLLRVIPLVPAVLNVVEKSRPAANEALLVYRVLRREGNHYWKSLKPSAKTGRLTLEERIAGEQLNAGPSGLGNNGRSRNLEFGILQGSTALISDYRPEVDLARVFRDCINYNVGSSEEAAINFIVGLDRKTSTNAVFFLGKARSNYVRFQRRLKDFLSFFDEANIETINSWASHRLNPNRFSIKLTPRSDGKQLELKRQDETIRINLHSSMWECDYEFPYE